MNSVGMMQGRLSPPGPQAQAFPWDTWENEFDLARAIGFNALEWLFNAPDFERNPLWTEAGRQRVRARVEATGVGVRSVCANYFIQHPFFRVPGEDAVHSRQVLTELIGRARAVGATKILIPVLEQAEIRSQEEADELLGHLRAPLRSAQAKGIVLALETELPAEKWLAWLANGHQRGLGIYYDTGNANAQGFPIEADLRSLAPYLQGIHLKDRARGGPNVPLGTGGVDFELVFMTLNEIGYWDTLVLETTVGDDYKQQARRNLDFVRTELERAQHRAQLSAGRTKKA